MIAFKEIVHEDQHGQKSSEAFDPGAFIRVVLKRKVIIIPLKEPASESG